MHMEAKVNQAIRDNLEMCLISIDMNWLKQINDNYGHKAGDFALEKVGQIISETAGELSVCTRFGGDEFAIAFTDSDCMTLVKEVIGNLDKAFDDFNAKKEKPYPITISKGYYVHIIDEDFKDFEKFVLEADRNMYKDKALFKATHKWEGIQEV